MPVVLIGLPTTIVRLSTCSPAASAIAPAMSATVTAPKSRPPSPARTLTLTGAASSLALISLGVVVVADRARGAGGLDRLDGLLAAAGPADAEATRDEVVAAVAVLDLDDVAGGAEAGDLLGQDELHRLGSSQRAVDV